MTDLTWNTIRNNTITTWNGQTPRPNDENTIIDLFETNPTMVLRSIEDITRAWNDGRVTYPWSALAGRLAARAEPPRNPTVETSNDRERAVTNAERWIHNTGLHFARFTEIEDELFGPQGRLKRWKDDTQLAARMRELWEHARPQGEQVEQDELERAAKWKASRAQLQQKPKTDTPAPTAGAAA